MSANESGMVVVGAGECGAQAALALRSQGWPGRITLIGDEALEPYERPPLSKKMLMGDDETPVHSVRQAAFDEAGVEFLRPERVSAIEAHDHRLVLETGRSIGYERLLLAVGAQPRRLPFPPDSGALYLRTHTDALAIRRHLAPGRRVGIIGAGFIGLELAAAARMRGCDVTVIEFADRALARAVPGAVAAAVIAEHLDRGVEFRWGVGAEQIRRAGDQTFLLLTSGEQLGFDLVVAGIGAAPHVALAERAGLKIDNGIELDDRLRTSDPDIFAAGDCASFPHPLFNGARVRLEAWRNAHDQAETVAANLLGADRPHVSVPWFWSDQYGSTLQVTGLTHLAERHVVRVRADGVRLHFGLTADDCLVSASAFGPGSSVAKDIRLAEILLRRQVRPPVEQLVDPGVSLKVLWP